MRFLFIALIEMIFFLQSNYIHGMFRQEPQAARTPIAYLNIINDENILHMLKLKKIAKELNENQVGGLMYSSTYDIPKSKQDQIKGDARKLFSYLLTQPNFSFTQLQEMLREEHRNDLARAIDNPSIDSANQLANMNPEANDPPLSKSRTCDEQILRKISNELSQDNLNDITFLYTYFIPERDKSKLEDNGYLLLHHFLTVPNFGSAFLKQMLVNATRHDLKNKVEQWEVENPKDARKMMPTDPHEPINHGPSDYPNDPPPAYSLENNPPEEPYVKCAPGQRSNEPTEN